MSRQEEIEFVCYAERGIYNLDQVLDELLPPTLERAPNHASSLESQRSFHDLLAIRSRTRDAINRKGYYAKRAVWLRSGTRLAGEILIFVGGVAIGAGFMASQRGEPLTSGAGAMIASGLTAIALTVLIRMMAKTVDQSLEHAARA